MADLVVKNAWRFLIDEIENLLVRLPNKDDQLIWFGRNALVDVVQATLLRRHQSLKCVIDNNAKTWGSSTEGNVLVFPVDKIVKEYKDSALFLIASLHHEEMTDQLCELGVSQSQIIILPFKESHEFIKNNLLEQTTNLKQMTLKEMQGVLLNLLKTLRDFCDSNHLRYFLAGGTLIGAIRHNGFIPWDDDADVYLPYEDYQRLLKTFPKKNRYEILNWESNDDFPLDFSKLVDNETMMYHPGYPIQWLQGVSVCIIPIVGFPEELELIQLRTEMNRKYDMEWYRYQNKKSIVTKGLNDCRKEIIELKYNYFFDEYPMVGKAHLQFKPMWCVSKSVFEKSILVNFEGEVFSAPQGYKEYLTHRFGDYMQVPPESERQSHGTQAYWKVRSL